MHRRTGNVSKSVCMRIGSKCLKTDCPGNGSTDEFSRQAVVEGEYFTSVVDSIILNDWGIMYICELYSVLQAAILRISEVFNNLDLFIIVY